MVKVFNMFREFSMEHVEGYTKLPKWQKNMFDITYKKHLSSMPIEERIIYTENHIKRVEGEISLLKVYFENEGCYLYLPENKWVKTP